MSDIAISIVYITTDDLLQVHYTLKTGPEKRPMELKSENRRVGIPSYCFVR